MKYRQLDAQGDYVVGQPFLTDSPQCVAQAVMTRLRMWKGEFFANTADGTPWLTDVLGPRASRNADAAIKARILATSGVTSLAAYASSYDGVTRKLTVTVTINTVFGAVTLTEALP